MSLFTTEDQEAFENYIQNQEVVSITWPGSLNNGSYCSPDMPLFSLLNGYHFQWGCTVSGSDLDAIDIFWIWDAQGERIWFAGKPPNKTKNPNGVRVERTKDGETLNTQKDMQRFIGNKITSALDGDGVLRLIFADGSFIESATWNIPFRYDFFEKT